MADKPIYLVNGVKTEKELLTVSAGAADSGKAIALDASGTIPLSMMPTGTGLETSNRVTSEGLSAGEFVNFWDDAGTASIRLADASNSRQADGFVIVSAVIGETVDVYTDGILSGVSTVTGTDYFLSDTPGQLTATPPATPASQIHQPVGRASNATEVVFKVGDVIVLA